ncbi:hypothetical protein ES705_17711 [subsurface metagenome]
MQYRAVSCRHSLVAELAVSSRPFDVGIRSGSAGSNLYMLHAFITLFLAVSISYVECRGRVAQIPFCHCEPRPLRIAMVGVWQSRYISNELSCQYCCFLSFCCPALISIFKINNIHPRWDFFCSSFPVPKNCPRCY